MNTITKNKSNIKKSSVEFIEDKKHIRSYLKGNKTRSELDERGIKLAMPI